MKLQWLGHSSFRLIESTGTTVITDPFHPASVGYGMAYLAADAITSSHGHLSHNNFQGVKGSPVIINTVGSFDIKGVRITSALTYHDSEEGARRGKNIIFKFRMDGVDICHLGDIGCPCSPEIVEQLAPIDILLLPVGANGYTIDAEEQAEYINLLMPEIVIPMHYKTEHCDADIEKVDYFLRMYDDDIIEYADSNTLVFERDDFQGAATRIIVPKRYKG